MQIWKRNIDLKIINKHMKNTMADHLGIIITKVSNNSLEGSMGVKNIVKQPYGILHGGASVALAETLGSLGSNLCIETNQATVGLEINANHIKSVKSGQVNGITSPIHLGRSTHIWEIKLYNNDKLTCISRLTMAILDK
jgi:1,4-dihydroxy-2-naphthoyl-CoA hydrolase